MGEVVHFWSSERNSAAQYTNKATDQHKDKWGSKRKGKRVVFGHLFVMGRLTADLILKRFGYTESTSSNKEGNKIPYIENLGATEDVYEVIDMSDNEIDKFENFPTLHRLCTLYLHNNNVAKIEPTGTCLKELKTLMLTNNKIQTLADVVGLAELGALEILSLAGNPVAKQAYYREYIIHILPNLKVLDFKKVKQKERKAANELFAGADGKKRLEGILSAKSEASVTKERISEERQKKIEQLLKNAKTADELNKIQADIASGLI